MRTLIIFSVMIFLLAGCRQEFRKSSVNYYEIPAFGDSGINMVVEIPAGTNHKIEYISESNSFKNDIKDGKERIINFLPYPGNYGFIPSTLMDKERGGDGDAMDILLIGESESTGTVIQVKPIGTLVLEDRGELDTKIIAVPSEVSKQVISPQSFQEFIVEYNAAAMIVENWFLSYKGKGEMKMIGWQDDSYALREIRKWEIREN